MVVAPIVGTKAAIRDALRTRSGQFGFGMLGTLLTIAIVIPIVAPYDVIRTWGDVAAWTDNPRNAAPEWLDVFTGRHSARNTILEWDTWFNGTSPWSGALKITALRARWDFPYDTFAPEIRLQLLANWSGRRPLVTVEWVRLDDPDRNFRNVTLYEAAPERQAPNINTIAISSDPVVIGRVRQWALSRGATDVANIQTHVTLHAVNNSDMLNANRARVLQGKYEILVTAIMFGETDWIEARYTSYGDVYGLVGTDALRRDLLIGLLWGAPVALAFGAVAAIVTVMAQVILGALGAYYGGKFDELTQRVTDFFIIIPSLPILILIGYLYQPSIVFILLIVIGFNIFGPTAKVVRSIALQVKEELYIESARSYGASRRRILFRYILPRTMPYTFALLALSVPSFIFLEASLSFLGVGDPVLPTWGAIMGDASRNGAVYNGLWWWIAFPALGIVFATVAFAFLGYAFDKVLNPRLREE